MKSRIYWVLATIVAMFGASCQGNSHSNKPAGPIGTISGMVRNAPAQKVSLMALVNRRWTEVAADFTGDDGSFTLQPEKGLEYDFYQLLVEAQFGMMLLTDSTQGVRVEIDALPQNPGFITAAKVLGSKESALIAEYVPLALTIQDSLTQVNLAMQANPQFAEQNSAEFTRLKQRAHEIAATFIQENKGSPVGLFALDQLNRSTSTTLTQEVLAEARKSMPQSAYLGAVEERLQAAKARTLPSGQPRPTAQQPTGIAVGADAPEILLNGLDGKARKLSDLKGKVVLIDFWASWCGPCRRENPTVVRAYQQFRDRGFEVFSVSLDKQKEPWERAIQQDGLVWPNHVSDLAGWNSIAASAYGVTSIPATFLLDQEGKVVATNLRGPALAAKLNELLPG
jgi:thiol-disulfide isomerase/thioredoxin